MKRHFNCIDCGRQLNEKAKVITLEDTNIERPLCEECLKEWDDEV
jgi:hypothetical protein